MAGELGMEAFQIISAMAYPHHKMFDDSGCLRMTLALT